MSQQTDKHRTVSLKTASANHLLNANAELAEGPHWDLSAQVLYWVDIDKRSLHKYSPATGQDQEIIMPTRVSMVFQNKEGQVMVALEKGIYSVDNKGALDLFYGDLEQTLPNTRLNDGKCDAAGRLWIGSMSTNGIKKQGSLYRIDPDKQCTRMLPSVSVSNGIEWSLDNRYMYYIDSPSGYLWRFDFELETGQIENATPIIDYRGEEGIFDGMTIDAEGCLWIAQWGGFQVSRWDPVSGKKISSVKVPVPNVSSCTFGGKNLDQLYITTAVGKDKATKINFPNSGSLYVYDSDVQGLPSRNFST